MPLVPAVDPPPATTHLSDVGLGPDPLGILPPPQPPPPRHQRVTFRSTSGRTSGRSESPILVRHPLVSYQIPLEKARCPLAENDGHFPPPGSLADPSILIRPVSPSTPFEFPF